MNRWAMFYRPLGLGDDRFPVGSLQTEDTAPHPSTPVPSGMPSLITSRPVRHDSSRQGRPIIAHRFNGGIRRRPVPPLQSPVRGERRFRVYLVPECDPMPFTGALESLPGLVIRPLGPPSDESLGYVLSPSRARRWSIFASIGVYSRSNEFRRILRGDLRYKKGLCGSFTEL